MVVSQAEGYDRSDKTAVFGRELGGGRADGQGASNFCSFPSGPQPSARAPNYFEP